jgi:hypothetical protein
MDAAFYVNIERAETRYFCVDVFTMKHNREHEWWQLMYLQANIKQVFLTRLRTMPLLRTLSRGFVTPYVSTCKAVKLCGRDFPLHSRANFREWQHPSWIVGFYNSESKVFIFFISLSQLLAFYGVICVNDYGLWMRKNVEGEYCDIFQQTILAVAWRDWGKLWKPSGHNASSSVSITV